MNQLYAHLVPHETRANLDGTTAVVIDVLRATTTIAAALGSGATEIVPVSDVTTARRLANATGTTRPLLGGERGGAKIDGFDLGNSPAEYSRSVVAGRRIVFTTSHGTKAIARSSSASHVLIASFVNLSAVVNRLLESELDIHLVCSGTDGNPSVEDSLCAAAIAGSIWEKQGQPQWHDDAAQLLLELHVARRWQDRSQRQRILASGRGGQRLTRLGSEQDIELAAHIDQYSLVPALDPDTESPCITAGPNPPPQN